jgi:hypothetical protein
MIIVALWQGNALNMLHPMATPITKAAKVSDPALPSLADYDESEETLVAELMAKAGPSKIQERLAERERARSVNCAALRLPEVL